MSRSVLNVGDSGSRAIYQPPAYHMQAKRAATLPVQQVLGHRRRLVADYEFAVDRLLAKLDRARHATAVAIASLPEEIRGFGLVKLRSVKAAKAKEAELFAAFDAPVPAQTKAA